MDPQEMIARAYGLGGAPSAQNEALNQRRYVDEANSYLPDAVTGTGALRDYADQQRRPSGFTPQPAVPKQQPVDAVTLLRMMWNPQQYLDAANQAAQDVQPSYANNPVLAAANPASEPNPFTHHIDTPPEQRGYRMEQNQLIGPQGTVEVPAEAFRMGYFTNDSTTTGDTNSGTMQDPGGQSGDMGEVTKDAGW